MFKMSSKLMVVSAAFVMAVGVGFAFWMGGQPVRLW
jgi:hypothetical protein